MARVVVAGAGNAAYICAGNNIATPDGDEVEVVARVLLVPESIAKRRDWSHPVFMQGLVLDILEERVVLLRRNGPIMHARTPWVDGSTTHGCV